MLNREDSRRQFLFCKACERPEALASVIGAIRSSSLDILVIGYNSFRAVSTWCCVSPRQLWEHTDLRQEFVITYLQSLQSSELKGIQIMSLAADNILRKRNKCHIYFTIQKSGGISRTIFLVRKPEQKVIFLIHLQHLIKSPLKLHSETLRQLLLNVKQETFPFRD